MWIDGVKAGEWGGIRWRSDDTLRVNALALWHYVTDDNYAAGQTQQTVWFDDVVVSTQYVACAGSQPDGGTPADGGKPGDAGADAGGGASPAASSGQKNSCGCGASTPAALAVAAALASARRRRSR